MRTLVMITAAFLLVACVEDDVERSPAGHLGDYHPRSFSVPDGDGQQVDGESSDGDGIIETGYSEEPPVRCEPEDCGPLMLMGCAHPFPEDIPDPVCEPNEDGVCEWTDFECPDPQDQPEQNDDPGECGVPDCASEDCGPRPEVICEEGVAELSCEPNLDLECEWTVGECQDSEDSADDPDEVECTPEDCGPELAVLCEEGVAQVSCELNADMKCEWVVGECQ